MGSAKEYLSKIALYDTHIRNKLEDLANMEDLATRITSTMKDVVVFGSGNGDKVGDSAAAILDLCDEIRRDVQYYRQKKREICDVIDQVQDPKQLEILQKCYVLHKTLEQAAREMPMSYRNACYIHGKALQAVTEIMKGENIEHKEGAGGDLIGGIYKSIERGC